VAEERELGLIAPETESKKDKKKKSKKKEKKKRDRDNEEESSESEKKEKKKDKKSKKKKDDKKKDDKKKKKKAKKEEEAPKTAPKAVSKTAAKPAPKVAAKSEPKSDSKSKGKVAEAPQVHLPDLDAPKVVDRYGFADRIATEEDVGIVAYLTDTVGFDGTLRQRFSDFIVNEIDLAQKVVHVTDVSDPMDVVQEKEQPNEAEKEKKTEELKTAISADLFDKIAVAVEKSEKISFTVDTLFDKVS
jgi:superfamily II DNA/RNA helicase